MSDNISTIAILGATSGLGEGLQIQQMDVSSITTLPSQISELLTSHPKIDTVLLMAGVRKSFSFTDPHSSSPSSIANKVTTNVTAPMVLAHLLIPHLLSQPHPTNFILVSSGLAFVPMPTYPVYCPTKAAIHAFAITLRGQLLGTKCNVIELAPPYVDTGLDAEHRERVVRQQGGEEKAMKPMPLEEYLDRSMKSFEKEGVKEIGTGFSQMGVDAWRGAFGPIYQARGLDV